MKILIFGQYPIANPIHGGQIRAKAIFDKYKEEGIEVKYCAIASVYWYDGLGDEDIKVYDREVVDERNIASYEISITNHVRQNPKLQLKLKKMIDDFKPDFIQIEQAYPYNAVSDLLNNYKLIYSSQNVEYKIKEEILKSQKINNSTIKREVHKIKHLECELIKRSQLVIVCSESDEAAFKKLGARKTLIAKNGINPRIINQTNLKNWQDRYEKKGVTKTLLYVGSAHQPNLDGFLELVGVKMGFLLRDTRLIIAGDVCRLIDNYLLNIPEHIAATFKLRVDELGIVSNDDMASLLSIADIIILPITEGGGTNLKTAEAIFSGKNIIASNFSFRGYDEFRVLPNVIFADNIEDFHEAMIKMIESKKYRYNKKNKKIIGTEKVTWRYVLNSLSQTIESLR